MGEITLQPLKMKVAELPAVDGSSAYPNKPWFGKGFLLLKNTKKNCQSHRPFEHYENGPGPPRCSRNAAWRQCFAKTSVPKIYADRPCNNKVPKTNRECDELTIIFGPRRCA